MDQNAFFTPKKKPKFLFKMIIISLKAKIKQCQLTRKQNHLIMRILHDKGEALAQSVHKLFEKPLLLPSVQDLHNLYHLLKQYPLIP
jgi:hypothetical protein